ncbi:MAG TPA: spore cortex-lytic enzyme [Bacilli bacterium]|uniref:Spore cortex-lytic enzyme n=2 Tax=Amphibacillus indicireducens TaxID=1076330 RepID=A0ABP7V808_9BACI|nr:spore cortex-lytic enzyme [Bacilli bacterium]
MKKTIVNSLLILVVIMGINLNVNQTVDAFSEQVIQQGATGEDVVELQARLQYIGFYHGQIDGVFGWGTYWALRNFQNEFGMKVDGYAGDQVKNMLKERTQYHKDFVRENIEAGRSFTHYGGMNLEDQVNYDTRKEQKRQDSTTKEPSQQEADTEQQKQDSQQSEQQQSPAEPTDNQTQTEQSTVEETPIEPTSVNVPNGFSQNDIQLMAQAVYGEARGEPYEGQVAVAAVILNRLQSPIFPDTVAGIIYEPLAFTAVADGQIYLTPDETSRRAVLDAINGWDPTGEAIYYFNPDTATSSWIWSRPQIKQIGKHIFCE